MTAEFERNEGRRPKILVAKIGQDGHDRGQKVIASAFSDFGFARGGRPALRHARAGGGAGGRRRTSTSSACRRLPPGHLSHVPALQRGARGAGRADIVIAVGGVVPPQDYEALRAAGVAAIFPPGTVAAEAAGELLDELNRGSATRSGRCEQAEVTRRLLRRFERQRSRGAPALARASLLIFVCRFCFSIASAVPRVW